MSYVMPGSDVFSGTLSSTTNYQPFIEGAQQAAGVLSNAATTAANQANNGINNGIGTLQTANNTAQNYYNPFVTGANSSYNNVLTLSGANGATPQQINNLVTSNPAYQFNLNQELDALNKGAAARGKLYSGQTVDDTAKLVAGYAANQYQNAFNNNLQATQLGLPLVQQSGQNANALGQNIAGMQATQGNNTAQGTLAAANAQATGLLQTGQALTAQTTAASKPYNYGGANGGVSVNPVAQNPNFQFPSSSTGGTLGSAGASASGSSSGSLGSLGSAFGNSLGNAFSGSGSSSGSSGGSSSGGGSSSSIPGYTSNIGGSGITLPGEQQGIWNPNAGSGTIPGTSDLGGAGDIGSLTSGNLPAYLQNPAIPSSVGQAVGEAIAGVQNGTGTISDASDEIANQLVKLHSGGFGPMSPQQWGAINDALAQAQAQLNGMQ